MSNQYCQASPPTVFGVDIPVVGQWRSAAPLEFSDVLNLCSGPKGDYLRRCLSDFREGIRSLKDTALFCYRSIESLQQFFLVEKGCKNRVQAWELLISELGVDKADPYFIKEFADPIRHGGAKSIFDKERGEVFKKTLNVIDKFIAYAKNGYLRVSK